MASVASNTPKKNELKSGTENNKSETTKSSARNLQTGVEI